MHITQSKDAPSLQNEWGIVHLVDIEPTQVWFANFAFTDNSENYWQWLLVSISLDSFSTAASNTVRNLYSDQDFTDVTIACEVEKQVKAFKVILNASSSFLHSIVVENPHEHPLLCLTGVRFDQLQKLVEFIHVYRCELCQKTFSDGSALTRHKKAKHSSEIPPVFDPFYEFWDTKFMVICFYNPL